jgi:hypothetical protein
MVKCTALTARARMRRQGGTYMVTLTVTDWLAQTAGASWTFVRRRPRCR